MQNTQNILRLKAIYHVYNRGNGNERLFLSDDNYRFFLKKYDYYIYPIADTFCYCLMPNHFHFLVKIKEEAIIEEMILAKHQKTKTLQGFETLAGLDKQKAISFFLSQQFSHLFNGYTQAFNKQQNRRGSLFMKSFKRKRINDEAYLRKVIHYIHSNPIEARLVQSPEDWKYSSYKAIISKTKTKLHKKEVIDHFNDMENFKYCHKHPPKLTGIE